MQKGRPRQFDLDDAIDKAMLVFWEKGYERTTIPDLIEAIGINRPSLYSAFGSKEGLFQATLDRYRSGPASYVNRALEEPDAYSVFRSLLYGVIELVTDTERPGGCLFVCGTLSISDVPGSVSSKLAERRILGELDIRKRFERALEEGDLPKGSDPSSLAMLASTLLWGLSVQASNGAKRSQLNSVAEIALKAFPKD